MESTSLAEHSDVLVKVIGALLLVIQYLVFRELKRINSNIQMVCTTVYGPPEDTSKGLVSKLSNLLTEHNMRHNRRAGDPQEGD